MKNNFLSKQSKKQLGVAKLATPVLESSGSEIIYAKLRQFACYLLTLINKTYRLVLYKLNPPPKFTTALITRSGRVRLIDSERLFVYSPKSRNTLLPLFLEDFFRFFDIPMISTARIKGKSYFKERFYGREQLHESYRCHVYFRQICQKYSQYLSYRKGLLMPDLFWGTMNILDRTLKSETFSEFIAEQFDNLLWAEEHMLYYPSHGNLRSEKVIVCKKRFFILNLVNFGMLMPGFYDVVILQNDLKSKDVLLDEKSEEFIEQCVALSFDEKSNLSPQVIHFISWVFWAANMIEKQGSEILPELVEWWEGFYLEILESNLMEKSKVR
ncbi:hypothetical protein KIH41_17860 [Litoribacter ruber]|uniref:hypothetical protein n=1 Tax=Litoribacter ruber TaxID=702568 RepID=UPI001BDA396A|nr:hypothetical protein [Litoribacter ruber]MBT0813159.1 hypothetical protein [Litoribacter ruber]